MAILDANDFPAIRAALDVSLDAAALPDAVIEQLPYAPAAELWLLARVPDAASKTGADLTRLITAAVYYTASLIAPAIPNITGEDQGKGYVYQRAAVNWDARARDLRGRAEDLLAEVLKPTSGTTARIPRMFALADGTRGE